MTEEQAYQKLQDLLELAEALERSGYFSATDIVDEVRGRLEK